MKEKTEITPISIETLVTLYDDAQVWAKAVTFDYAHISVTSYTIIYKDGPGRWVLRFQTYNGCLSLKRQTDLDPSRAIPVVDELALVGKLGAGGYLLVSAPVVEEPPKRRGRKPRV